MMSLAAPIKLRHLKMWWRLPSSKINHEKLWKWNTIGTCFSSTKNKKTRREIYFRSLLTVTSSDESVSRTFFPASRWKPSGMRRRRRKKARNSISSNCMLYKLCWRWKEKFILESSIPLPPTPPTVMYLPCSDNGWRIRKHLQRTPNSLL